MSISSKVSIFTGLVTLLVMFAGYVWYVERRHEKEVRGLQNEIAKRDKTIEVQQDVYAKLAISLNDARTAIDLSTAEGKRLADEVKKNGAALVAVTNVVVKLKNQIAEGQGQQSEPIPGRLKVEFGHDFGFARVDGHTFTSPSEYQLKLSQGSRPLKLTVALTQQPDLSWRSIVSSSDPYIAVDIGVSAVNPHTFTPRWYERIKLRFDAGAGDDNVLAGFGVTFNIGKYDIGPSIWGDTSEGLTYGGSITWTPFQR
jgi:hypothetical protein